MLTKARWEKHVCWINLCWGFKLFCGVSWLVFYRTCMWVPCITSAMLCQVSYWAIYYIRKAIHTALVMRYKHQNVLFYKSLNMVCVLKSYNIVLCKDPCEHKSLWIYNLPLIIIYVKRNKSCWSFTASSFQVETAVKYSTQSHCKYVPPPTFLLNWKKAPIPIA